MGKNRNKGRSTPLNNSNEAPSSLSGPPGPPGHGHGGQKLLWNPTFPLENLTKSDRIQQIIRHRAEINGLVKFYEAMARGRSRSLSRPRPRPSELKMRANETINPGGEDNPPKFFNKLKSINIRNMDPYQGTYSKGDKITLDIIEDAQSFTRVMLLGQDQLGDVVHVALYCDSPSTQDDQLQEKVGFGTKITIANPFMKIALDGRTMIRVEKDKELFIHRDKDVRKCRCCGKPGAGLRCGRCKMAYYCSRECQSMDWTVLQHKNVCDALISNWTNNIRPNRIIGLDMFGSRSKRTRQMSIWFWPGIIGLSVFCCAYFLL